MIPVNDRFDMLIAVDSIYEGIDFDLRFSSPFHIGRKALAINLSDIAAMGGIPKYFWFPSLSHRAWIWIL